MHGVVGTALGGVCTIVGEPQNLLIANVADWTFMEFLVVMSPITVPVFLAGMLTCFGVEKLKIAGFGAQFAMSIRSAEPVSWSQRAKRKAAFAVHRYDECATSTMVE